MPSLEKILSNVGVFLERKLEDQQEKVRLMGELTSTVADLVRHVDLPVRKRLLALFKRFEINEAIASSLVTSLVTGIEKARERDFEISTQDIDTLFLPLLTANKEIVTARAKSSIPELEGFPDDKVINLIEEATIPFAQLLGSNVAEALALHDPGAIFKGKRLAQAILEGIQVDPVQLGNMFTALPPEKKQELIDLLANKVTLAQKGYEQRQETLLRNGRTHQWIYDRLREVHIPHKTAKEITPIIAYNYSVEDLDTMDKKKFMRMVVDVISSVPTHTD